MIAEFFGMYVVIVVKMMGKLGMSDMVVFMAVVGGVGIVVRQVVLHFVSHGMQGRMQGMVVAI